jgi:hypothetical protein
MNAKTRAFIVYKHSKEHSDAEHSGIYALGHYEGLKDALRLLETQDNDTIRAAFENLPHPAHSPKARGSW